MAQQFYQKGKFYTLPIIEIRNEGTNSFFIVDANGREYAIKMFDFQKTDSDVSQLKELPCMVKDVHGDNIVFVQNFAQMFGNRYVAGNTYQFVVNKEANNANNDFRYYDVRDKNGLPFRLKCDKDTYLIPNQKISCLLSRPSLNKLILSLVEEDKQSATQCVTPETLLEEAGVEEPMRCYIIERFHTHDGFAEARQFLNDNNAAWIIKTVMAVSNAERWTGMRDANKLRLLNSYRRVCAYLLEDTDYLLQFSESERDNYQEWVAERVAVADTYIECLQLMKENRCSDEIDAILGKIRRSGFILHPHRRMQLMIAIFSMQPQLLDDKFDSILNLVAECAKNWKQQSFTNAFSNFLRFYITSNSEKTSRVAVVDDEKSRVLLNRMVRSICFLLLMTDHNDPQRLYFRSMLMHCLSFVRSKQMLNTDSVINKANEDKLVERAFNALQLADDNGVDLTWNSDFGSIDLLAYRMANAKDEGGIMMTRSFEAHNVRFTVSPDGITLSRSVAGKKERNVLPQGFPGWHNLQLFLDSPSKYTISKQTKAIKQWKTFWTDVEHGLFEKRTLTKKKITKWAPEVGTEVFVRVLRKDSTNPYRFFCKIEDTSYEGEGWIDVYQKGGSIGMFHYDPKFDVNSFTYDGQSMLLRVRVNSVSSPNEEKIYYTFDCMSFIDNMTQEQVAFHEESNCTIVHHDIANNVFLGITSRGYGIFIPVTPDNDYYAMGDTVRVRVTNSSSPRAIQGEIVGPGTDIVNIKEAAEDILQTYWRYEGGAVHEETEEELEEQAMEASEENFDAAHMAEIINILDHKAIMSSDTITAYAFLAIAHILAKMIDNESMLQYIEQRQHLLGILDDYATNGSVNDQELESLDNDSNDLMECYPYLRQRLTELRIITCLGRADLNSFLWNICNTYSHDKLGKLSRLMLSYNLAEGFALNDYQEAVVAKIKSLLNVNVTLPKIYSFGEETQQREFKTSIVFPPNNNMRADIKQQTFNVMKVICGMANSYGGTVYLGVQDTGTARGLEEDLKFFGDNRDKYDLHVRNSIHEALGNAVNMSCHIEHPDAGKHYIYAIKVAASKTPVMLKTDNQYYLREGTSTWPVNDLAELQKIMDERDFSKYDVYDDTPSDPAIAPSADNGNKGKQQKTPAQDVTIATSKLRKNITENWDPDYMVNKNCFVRLMDVETWCVLDDIDYPDGILTLAVHEDETDGSLIVAYGNGMVNRVPMSQICDKTRGSRNKMYADECPMFVSPAKKSDVLLSVCKDDKDKVYFRLDDIATIPEGKMLSTGQLLTDVKFEKMMFYELIDHDDAVAIKRLYNLKRSTLGVQVLSSYFGKEKQQLEKAGIDLSVLKE